MDLTTPLSDSGTIYEYSYTTGTGSYTLAGAIGSFFPFSAAHAAGAVVVYRVTDASANTEVTIGTFDGVNILTRDQIVGSTNGNAPINWTGRTRLLIHDLTDCCQPIVAPPPPPGTGGVHFSPAPPPSPPPPPPPPGPTPPPIILDGSSGGYATDQATVDNAHNIIGGIETVLLQTTIHSNTVLVAFVSTSGTEFLGAGSPSAPPTVTGITGAGLTWLRRSGFSAHLQRALGAILFQAHMNLEVWYAVAPTPLHNETFTASLSGSARAAAIVIHGFAGVNTSVIWDSNGSLPQTSVENNVPPSQTISTDNPSTVVITFFLGTAGFALINQPTLAVPFHLMNNGWALNGYPGRIGYAGTWGDFSSVLTSYLVQPLPNSPIPGQGIFMVDALTA